MSLRLRSVVAAGCLLACACHPAPTPAEKASEDARDIAMVEAAQERHPPIQPIEPEPLTFAAIERLKLFGTSCAFVGEGETDPVALAFDKRAVLLLGGEAVMLASDPGGQLGPLGTWQHYVGKALSLSVAAGPGDGVRIGEEVLRWPARMELRDEFDRIVYTRSGELRCGS